MFSDSILKEPFRKWKFEAMNKLCFSNHHKYLLLLCGFASLAAFRLEILRTTIAFSALATITLIGAKLARSINWNIYYPVPANRKIPYLIAEAVVIGMLTALFVLSSVKLLGTVTPELALRFKYNATLTLGEIARAVMFVSISEEIIFRLFIMTLTYWLFKRTFNEMNSQGVNPGFLRWSFLISAVLFSLAHIPGWVHITDKFEVYGFVTLLDMIASYAFSWMFYNRGIYLVIIAHFSADVFGHIIGARLMFN